MKAQINKSDLFKMAHAMVRKATCSNLSEALRQAWKVMKVKAQMLVGKAEFTFRKLNGEIRKAVGTLCNINYTPKTPANGKPRAPKPADLICYFDVEANGFRSFTAASLL